MIKTNLVKAIEFGNKAVELAKQNNDNYILVNTSNT